MKRRPEGTSGGRGASHGGGLRRAAMVGLILGWHFVGSAADALDRWLENQAGMSSWTAAFRQTRVLAVLKDPLEAKGRVWFAAPNRFRWELGDPAQTVAVRGSEELAVIYPRLKRAEQMSLAAMRGPLRDALALLEAGFPRSRADLEERFTLRSLTEIPPGAWRLVMAPRSAEARRFMESITLEFEVTGRGPRGTELRFADGSVLRNEFSEARVNPELAADWFTPVIPEGYKVTRMPGGG